VVRDQKGAFEDLFEELVSEGYARVEIDGEEYDLTMDDPDLDENFDHTVDVIVDRVKVSAEDRPRIIDSVETALDEAEGVLKVILPEASAEVAADLGEEARRTGALGEETEENDRFVVEFSKDLACTHCGIDIPEIETRSFSFNSPHGACPECEGLGETKEVDEGPRSAGRVQAAQARLRALELQPVVLPDPPRRSRGALRRLAVDALRGTSRRISSRRFSTGRTARCCSSGARKRHPPEEKAFRGRYPQPRAALPRDRLRLDAGAHRGTTCRRRRVRPATAPG